MGDIGAGNPRRAKSNGGIVGEVSLKCHGVLGPAASVVVSGKVLDWEPNGWLDWGSQPKQWVEHGFCVQFLLQCVDSVCLLPGRSVRSRLVATLGFSYGLPVPN